MWVDLRALFPPETSSPVADGLVVDEVVPGSLLRWERTASGGWVGVCGQPGLALGEDDEDLEELLAVFRGG